MTNGKKDGYERMEGGEIVRVGNRNKLQKRQIRKKYEGKIE